MCLPPPAPPGTSSSAAVKGFQEVTLLLAGSICPAGRQTPSWSNPHTRSDPFLQARITRRETYFQLGAQWQIRVLFLQTSCLRRSSRSLSLSLPPLHKDDARASETARVTDWINYRRARQVEVSDYTGYSVTRESRARRSVRKYDLESRGRTPTVKV